jgi:hypothetical protein
LRLRDKKKYFKAKRKTLFYFKIFTYRGEKRRKDERVRESNNRRAMPLPGIQILYLEEALQRERVLFFIKQGKNTPNL